MTFYCGTVGLALVEAAEMGVTIPEKQLGIVALSGSDKLDNVPVVIVVNIIICHIFLAVYLYLYI